MNYKTHVTKEGQKVLNLNLWGDDDYIRDNLEDFLDEVKTVVKDILSKESDDSSRAN